MTDNCVLPHLGLQHKEIQCANSESPAAKLLPKIFKDFTLSQEGS